MAYLSSRVILLTFLYFIQGLPYGLQARFLPVYLRSRGHSLTSLGFFQMLLAPWLCKALWAPLIDKYSTKQKWLLCSITGLMLTCAITSTIPPDNTIMLCLCIFALNLFAATQDIAVDSIALTILPPDELGKGNTAQVVGYKIGAIFGGGILVWFMDVLGWTGLFLTLTLLYIEALLFVYLSPTLRIVTRLGLARIAKEKAKLGQKPLVTKVGHIKNKSSSLCKSVNEGDFSPIVGETVKPSSKIMGTFKQDSKACNNVANIKENDLSKLINSALEFIETKDPLEQELELRHKLKAKHFGRNKKEETVKEIAGNLKHTGGDVLLIRKNDEMKVATRLDNSDSTGTEIESLEKCGHDGGNLISNLQQNIKNPRGTFSDDVSLRANVGATSKVESIVRVLGTQQPQAYVEATANVDETEKVETIVSVDETEMVKSTANVYETGVKSKTNIDDTEKVEPTANVDETEKVEPPANVDKTEMVKATANVNKTNKTNVDETEKVEPTANIDETKNVKLKTNVDETENIEPTTNVTEKVEPTANDETEVKSTTNIDATAKVEPTAIVDETALVGPTENVESTTKIEWTDSVKSIDKAEVPDDQVQVSKELSDGDDVMVSDSQCNEGEQEEQVFEEVEDVAADDDILGDTAKEYQNSEDSDTSSHDSFTCSSVHLSSRFAFIWKVLTVPNTRWIVIYVLIYKLGEQGALGMLPLFLIDQGVAAVDVTFWTGVIGQATSIFGSCLGGWILSHPVYRLPCRLLIYQLCLCRMLPLGLLLWVVMLWSAGIISPVLLYRGAIASMNLLLIVSGMITTSTFTLMMECSQKAAPSVQATHYTLLSSMEVFGKLAFMSVCGTLVDMFGYTTMYLSFVLLSAALLPWLWRYPDILCEKKQV